MQILYDYKCKTSRSPAETILKETEVLHKIPSNMYLFDQENTKWDPVFHLYSGFKVIYSMTAICNL